ncbi:MAG: cytochrome c, partial [Pseudomonadota bacterium]|nr:cytochrome c [Pseudomonadota bacterium]
AIRLASEQTDTPTFHRDAQRTGWNSHETSLTPLRVSTGSFGLVWQSPQLDATGGDAPRLYASPLYVDQVRLSTRKHMGRTLPVVVAATNTGFVYAINASAARGVVPGAILWRTRLGAPCRLQPAPLDGVPTGVLSTPVVDVQRQRIYVTHCDPEHRWQAYALDLGSGATVRGWPVPLDEATFNSVNRNAGPPVAPARRFDFRVQRGALNLSPDGQFLYVTFGETETGWMVAVDTLQARVTSAFAAQAVPYRGGGGMWGAGGPALDKEGNIYVATGTSYNGFIDRPRDWTQSLLRFSHDAHQGFALSGTYTPFNHCATAMMDIDLGSGGASLLPDLDPSQTATPRLLVLGGKQGNAYLLDRSKLPGSLERRPACSDNSATDGSLLPPEDQPQFGNRGPLNVFGPYSEDDAAIDTARGRSIPAYFRSTEGRSYVFLTGNSRREQGSTHSVPPSLVRLEVVTRPGDPAYLRVDQRQMRITLQNPGSPFVTSNGARGAIVWVLDENAPRSALLAGPHAPRPVLYAFDAMTLDLLWQSKPGDIFTSGKYNEPASARGMVFVGSDRIQAFGLGARPAVQSSRSTAMQTASAGNAVKRAEDERPVSEAAAANRVAGETTASPLSPRRVRNGSTAYDGEAIYQERCAACHDHPQGSTPPREVVVKRSRQQIVDALVNGAMRPFAAGLNAIQIDAVVQFLR